MFQKVKSPTYLQQDEHTLMMLHRHWIVFVYKMGYILTIVVTSAVLISMRGSFLPVFGSALFWGGLSLYWMFFLTYIMISWIHDELDLFIITDKRIIGIEQISSLSRRVSECSLDRVQEVNAETSGIMETLFQYGRVHIHTASENSDMIVRYAPHPVKSARDIDTIISHYRNQQQ